MSHTDYSIVDPATVALVVRDDLIFRPQSSSGDAFVVIEDPLRGKFFRVGLREYTFIALLNAQTSIAAAVGQAAMKLGSDALVMEDALAVARWLVESKLARLADDSQLSRPFAAAKAPEAKREPFNPLAIKLPTFNPDRLLDAALPWTRWLFGPLGVALTALVTFLAAYQLVGQWDKVAAETAVVLSRDHWLSLAVAWLLLKTLHEAAHALACKSFGGNVTRAGVMLILFSPVAFVDVTSSWRFASKWQRIAVAAAGMYAELIIAGIAALVWAHSEDGATHRLAFSVAMMASAATVLFNANPLMRFDGYFILADLLGIQNLYARSRQALAQLGKRLLLGIEPTVAERSPGTTRILLAYAVASSAWRASLFVTIVLAAISLLGPLGAVLAGVWTVWYVVVPAVRGCYVFATSGAAHAIKGGRVLLAGVSIAALVVFAGWLLALPARVDAPAVIEFADLAHVRAGSPGVVRDVPVKSGDRIEAGRAIAVLENPELVAELSDLTLTIEQSVLKARIHLQSGEQAKLQVEQAQRDSLIKRQAELQKQVDALTIRAPRSGQLVGRRLATLVGQFVEQGEEIAVVGDSQVKELVLCVSQADVDLLTAQRGQPVQVAIDGQPLVRFHSLLKQVNPRAEVELPHPALSALNGGPLPVKLVDKDDNAGEQAPTYELLRPHFVGKAPLSMETSAALFAGQRATVSFRSASASIGRRWYQLIDQWLHDRLSQANNG